jgi:hypothetical protein
MDKILHDKRSTAATLDISVRTLEKLVATGEIIPRRIGRRILFDLREIERFARREQQAKQDGKSGRQPATLGKDPVLARDKQ